MSICQCHQHDTIAIFVKISAFCHSKVYTIQNHTSEQHGCRAGEIPVAFSSQLVIRNIFCTSHSNWITTTDSQ